MRTIKQIIARKRAGIDCTQEESAAIKAHLRQFDRLFPLEWDEVLGEPRSVTIHPSLLHTG